MGISPVTMVRAASELTSCVSQQGSALTPAPRTQARGLSPGRQPASLTTIQANAEQTLTVEGTLQQALICPG